MHRSTWQKQIELFFIKGVMQRWSRLFGICDNSFQAMFIKRFGQSFDKTLAELSFGIFARADRPRDVLSTESRGVIPIVFERNR